MNVTVIFVGYQHDSLGVRCTVDTVTTYFFSPRAMMHSLHHGVGAWIVLIPFTNYLTAITLAVLDGISHHIADFSKSTLLMKNKNWDQGGPKCIAVRDHWIKTYIFLFTCDCLFGCNLNYFPAK